MFSMFEILEKNKVHTSRSDPRRAKTTQTTHLYYETTRNHSLFFKTQLKPAKKYSQEHDKSRAPV